MARKEVYARTGIRLLVRIFGGWGCEPEEVARPEFARRGYDRGVAMGGDLPPRSKADGSPTFMIRALRDPDGANLDRIQMIKGWVDADGRLFERIYDVAVSDGRVINGEGRCLEPVGNTVSLADPSFTNSIGDPLLATHWSDPDFDPTERAFYSVRVLEIPTPRWTAFDAKFFGIEMPEEPVMELQERAYSSPIWYTS